MNHDFSWKVFLVAMVCLWSSLGISESNLKAARFISMSIRDKNPTIKEIKSLMAKETTLDQLRGTWIASQEHGEKVYRYFREMFGVPWRVFAMFEDFVLSKTDEEIYYFTPRGSCEQQDAIEVTAWWSNDPVRVCPKTVSAEIRPIDPATNQTIDCFRLGSVGSDLCGCGPNLELCAPREYFLGGVLSSMMDEVGHRGRHAYLNNLSWVDLFAGKYLFANRFLYYEYIYSQTVFQGHAIPTKDMETLKLWGNQPWQWRQVELPSVISGHPVSRGGVATLGFFKRFNNNRSRIAEYTKRLLCQDVTAELNVGNIDYFINPDLTDFDRSHGAKAECAGCHYMLDNAMSTLNGWDEQGFFNLKSNNEPFSILGISFGKEVAGPVEMLEGFVTRSGDRFHTCMAKTAYNHFTGLSWDELQPEERSLFLQAAKATPKTLIQAILNWKKLPEMRK